MRKALSDKTVIALKPRPKRYEVRDSIYPGFGVRVSPTGHKSFFLSYRYGTLQRRIDIGRYPIVTLQAGREKALELLRDVHQGIDPSRKKAERSFKTADVLDDFIERYAKVKTRGWKAARALLMREVVGPYGQMDIRLIERSHIVSILDDMIARAPMRRPTAFSPMFAKC